MISVEIPESDAASLLLHSSTLRMKPPTVVLGCAVDEAHAGTSHHRSTPMQMNTRDRGMQQESVGLLYYTRSV